MAEKKVITKPIDYAVLNQFSKDFKTRFVPQTELSAEQDFWSRYSVQPEEPNLSASTTIVEVPKELPKVRLVNSSLKKLKFHLASFDMVVKERTTATAITKGTWGFEHTKACFRDNIIPFVKALKELLNSFDQFLIDELSKVQQVFKKMEQAVEQHCRNTSFSQESAVTFAELFKINDLKAQSQGKDTVILKLREKFESLSGDVKERKVKRETEEIETLNIELDHNVTKLVAENKDLKQTYKQLYDSVKPSRVRSKEQSLKESLSKLKGKYVVNEAVPLHSMNPELLKIDVAPLAPKLRKNRTVHTDYIRHTQEEAATLREIIGKRHCVFFRNVDDKERKEESKVEDIETQNLELDHRVTQLTAKNNHLKQTYKQLFDSIKSSRVQSKEQCDDLINKVNLKSVEVADLNASIQEKALVVTALKEQIKGKAVLPKAVSLNLIDPALLQVDVVPLIPKLRKNRTAYIDYIKHTLKEAATLSELVESERLLSPLNTPLAYACKYTRRIQELLMILQQTCPRITNLGTNLVAVTPKKNHLLTHQPHQT
nr:hypothetical protein [Tanacetum cinerariifolium]